MGKNQNLIKPGRISKGLRLKFYENVYACNGQVVSGIADQYGRILKPTIDKNGRNDLTPTGIGIAAYH